MLKAIVSVLSEGDRVGLDIARTKQGLRVTVTPLLNDDPEKVPEEARATRAALAMPLVVTAETAEDVETALAGRYAGYAAARGELVTSYEALLDALKEASKEATSKAAGKTAGKHTPKVAVTPAPTTEQVEAKTAETAQADAAAVTAGDASTITF